MILTFNDFVLKHNLKNKATSYIKIQQILSSLSLNNVGINLRDGPFIFDIGIVNLHPSKGTHWVCYINENYFDSYACVPPKILKNYLNLLSNGMDIVYIQNIKYRKMIVFVQVIVYIYFT